jgi:Fe-S cluster biosynthesis and repair protein YggX
VYDTNSRENGKKTGERMARMVNCVKLGRELPGLNRQPYPGAIGQRIYEQVSAQAWEMWMQHSVILINHYGLSLADPRAQEFLEQQMEEFFFGEDAQMPEGWTPIGQGVKGSPRK